MTTLERSKYIGRGISSTTTQSSGHVSSAWRKQSTRRTLGAKLAILPQPFIRKSALMTPPIRVPNISLLLFRRTAALSSNRMILPSGLRTAFLVRTMTARRTSPLRTLTAVTEACAAADTGRARLTTQTISSPTEPQPLLTFCFRILTHSTSRAPELSMTCWSVSVKLRSWTRTDIEGCFQANHSLCNTRVVTEGKPRRRTLTVGNSKWGKADAQIIA